MSKPKDKSVEEPAAIYGINPKRRRMGVSETVQRIREGLPIVEFEALHQLIGISAEALAAHIGISRSTLMRRRKSGHLDMLESDRLLRYARLYRRALEIIGEADAASEWLKVPARALGLVAPLTFAETEAGAREVENLLGRIEHGIFS